MIIINQELLFNPDTTRSTKLNYVLEHEYLCNLFEGYLKQHYAWENFGFYYAVMFFKRTEKELQKAAALDIHFFYLSEDAIFKLNVSSDTAEHIFQTIEHGNGDINVVFDDVMNFTVIPDLTNSLLEFIDSLQFPEHSQSPFPNNCGAEEFLLECRERQGKCESRRGKGAVGIFALFKSVFEL